MYATATSRTGHALQTRPGNGAALIPVLQGKHAQLALTTPATARQLQVPVAALAVGAEAAAIQH